MKTPTFSLSRNYVEFGPFSKAEMTDFAARGLFKDGDHIQITGSEAWLPMEEWLSAQASVSPPAPKPKAPKASAKKAAKKSA